MMDYERMWKTLKKTLIDASIHEECYHLESVLNLMDFAEFLESGDRERCAEVLHNLGII